MQRLGKVNVHEIPGNGLLRELGWRGDGAWREGGQGQAGLGREFTICQTRQQRIYTGSQIQRHHD